MVKDLAFDQAPAYAVMCPAGTRTVIAAPDTTVPPAPNDTPVLTTEPEGRFSISFSPQFANAVEVALRNSYDTACPIVALILSHVNDPPPTVERQVRVNTLG